MPSGTHSGTSNLSQMANDNAMNLRNKTAPRPLGNDQVGSAKNINEHQAMLQSEGESSGHSAH